MTLTPLIQRRDAMRLEAGTCDPRWRVFDAATGIALINVLWVDDATHCMCIYSRPLRVDTATNSCVTSIEHVPKIVIDQPRWSVYVNMREADESDGADMPIRSEIRFGLLVHPDVAAEIDKLFKG